MGAVAALQYAKKNNDIGLAVYDSPFCSLRELAVQIGKQKTRFPKFFIELFLDYLKPIIAEKARFNIDELEITKDISTIKVPGIFIGSTKDKLVPFQQVQKLFQSYAAKKQLFLIDQGHNEPRNKEDIEKVFKSIRKYTNNLPQETMYMQTEFDETTKSKKKLNLTLKCFSQKELCAFKSNDKPEEKPKKALQVRHLKKTTSNNKSTGCQSLKETLATQDLGKSIVKEKEPIRLSIKNTTKCSQIKKPIKEVWKLRVRESLDDISRVGAACEQIPQISKGYHGLEKRIGLKKFKSQSIKEEIMKNNLSSDNISYRRVVDHGPQRIILNECHSSEKDMMLKARNTVHHLEIADNDSYSFKRISFTKGNKKNKEN